MKKVNRAYLLINLLLVLVATFLSFGFGKSCCLNFGYGLGDVMYIIPFWGLSFLYFILMLIFRKRFFSTIYPILIFGAILTFFILNLIFNRGPECPCHLY